MLKINHLVLMGILTVFLAGCLRSEPQGLDATSGVQVDSQPRFEIKNGNATADEAPIIDAKKTSFQEQLDESDLPRLKQAQTTAFQQQKGGVPIAWLNPNTGHSGQVKSGPTYKINGRQCRDYIHTIKINGSQETENGVACREADGAWQAVPQ